MPPKHLDADSIALTLPMHTRDNFALMASKSMATFKVIETRFPGLVDSIRDTIQESEIEYEGSDNGAESFLWEHTLHVASIADRLAIAEGIDPLIPVIAALFHDAGKFIEGEYHSDGTIDKKNRPASPKFF